MISLEFNQEGALVEERLSKSALEAIVSQVNDLIPEVQDGVIAATYVSDHEIRRLNRMYRKKDEVTDVLSFSYESNERSEKGLGDVVISLAEAKRQMQDDDLELEIADLLVHGILHVLGYDHEKPEDAEEMFTLQDKIIATVL